MALEQVLPRFSCVRCGTQTSDDEKWLVIVRPAADFPEQHLRESVGVVCRLCAVACAGDYAAQKQT